MSTSAPKDLAEMVKAVPYAFGDRVVLAHDPNGDSGTVCRVLLKPSGIEVSVRWTIGISQWHDLVELAPAMG